MLSFVFVDSSRLGDSEDLPDIRVDAASPGPRVTFNIQDSVRITLYSFHRMSHTIWSQVHQMGMPRQT